MLAGCDTETRTVSDAVLCVYQAKFVVSFFSFLFYLSFFHHGIILCWLADCPIPSILNFLNGNDDGGHSVLERARRCRDHVMYSHMSVCPLVL